MRKQAFTMVEMLLAAAISAVIMTAVTAIYAFSTWRTGHAVATSQTLLQTRDLSAYLENTIQNATSCTTFTSGLTTGLKCIMPATVATTDAYGVGSSYTPQSADSSGPHWGTGKRRWFYWSDSTGAFVGLNTSTLWMAERSDDVVPLSTDAIAKFTYYYGNTSTPRWPLIDTFSFSVDTTYHTVTYTVGAADLLRTQAAATSARGTDAKVSRTTSFSRTVHWRNGQT